MAMRAYRKNAERRGNECKGGGSRRGRRNEWKRRRSLDFNWHFNKWNTALPIHLPQPLPLPPRPALLHLPLVLSVYSSWNNYWDRYLQAMYVPDPWSLAGWNSNWLDCRTHHWATYKCAEKESVLYMEEVQKRKIMIKRNSEGCGWGGRWIETRVILTSVVGLWLKGRVVSKRTSENRERKRQLEDKRMCQTTFGTDRLTLGQMLHLQKTNNRIIKKKITQCQSFQLNPNSTV